MPISIGAGVAFGIGPAGNLARLANGTHPSQMKKTCEHCGKTSSVSMYARWHGENCKKAPQGAFLLTFIINTIIQKIIAHHY